MQAARSQPSRISPDSVARALGAGAVVIDGRPADVFDAGHVAGAVNIPAGGEDSGALAARLLSPDVPLIAVATWRAQASWMADRLGHAGFRWVLGALDGADANRAFAGRQCHRSGAVSVDQLAGELATGAVLLVDVRDGDEWRAAHVPGSAHLPPERLREAAHLLPAVPIVTVCSGTPAGRCRRQRAAPPRAPKYLAGVRRRRPRTSRPATGARPARRRMKPRAVAVPTGRQRVPGPRISPRRSGTQGFQRRSCDDFVRTTEGACPRQRRPTTPMASDTTASEPADL